MTKISVYISCLFVLLISLQGCADNNIHHNKGEIIMISDFKGNKLDLMDFVEGIELYELETDDFLIGEVGDICLYDSSLFLLDKLTLNIVTYSLKERKVTNQINRRGNGPYEYIEPMALCVDSDKLYLLDAILQKVIVFNKSLEPIQEFQLDFAASDMVKTSDGFLFCTVLPEPFLNYNKIIHTNNKGKVQDTFVHSHQYGLTMGKTFVKHQPDEIYIGVPYSNQIYLWTEEELQNYYYTDFGSYNIPVEEKIEDLSLYDFDYIHNNNFFVTSSYFINAFSFEGKMYYHFKEHFTGKSYCGTIKNSKDGLPFFPRWQYGNLLIGLCPIEYIPDTYKKQLEQNSSQEGTVALLFKMKKL